MDPAMSELLTPTVIDNMDDMDNSELSITPAQSPSRSNDVSPNMPHSSDATVFRQENRVLKSRMNQLQNELQSEQESVSNLRKRLNVLEREKLDGVAKANDQVTRVESDVTRMRAAVEKGEAVRQNLEYELTKLKRDLSQEKRHTYEKENLLTDVNQTMKQKVSELSLQIEHLCQELEISKSNAYEENASLQFSLNEKELQMSSLRSEKDVLEAEKEKVEMALTQQEQSVRELENRIKELESDKRSTSDGIRRQVGEVDLMKEREQRMMRDLEAAMTRIKTLEEAVESERAAHLESKFNSEIVQLRVRDLEGALGAEKNAKSETVSEAVHLKNQLKELQQLCDEQQRESIQSREKLEKAEKEYALVNQQLQSDLEKKNDIINKLSKQLELHQRNFDELKEELSKAKMRQIYLEETYGGNMRELELLLTNFCFEGEEKKTQHKTSRTRKGKESKNLSPSVVLENLRHTLIEYKKRLNNTAAELTKLKTQHDQLAQESHSYKSMIWSKDKALEQTTQGMTRTSREIQQFRSELNEKEQNIKSLHKDLEDMRQALKQEQTQHQELKEQMVKVATKCKTDEQAHIESLHGVYQQLLTGRMSGTGQPSQVSQSPRFTWNDLIMLVQEEVANMMHSYHRSYEKLQHIETMAGSKEEAMKQLQHVHEEQISKLARATEDKGQFWQEQKGELEEHYGQLLAELHNRQKKTQSLADQAWERVRITQTVQQGLESEVDQLRRQVSQFGAENNILLTTCALMTGALYPMFARCAALGAQRRNMYEYNCKLEHFKLQVQRLVSALNAQGNDSERPESSSSSSRSIGRDKKNKHPILRFRRAVIAVLAVNRIVHLSKGNCRMFTAVDALPGMSSAIVCVGGLPKTEKNFEGVSKRKLLGNHGLSRVGEKEVASWLASPDLLNSIITNISDLQAILTETKEHGLHSDPKLLASTARTCFTKLMCHLPSNFASVFVEKESSWERHSLLRLLGQGLNWALSNSTELRNTQNTLSALQSQILDFTKRLHTAEVEKRDMRMELGTLRQERQAWLNSTSKSQNMTSQIDNFKEQIDTMVARDQFDNVCAELDKALSRERQAQNLLSEQAKQLQSISEKYNKHAMSVSQKDKNLMDTAQELTEAKQDVRKHEQVVRQFTRQVKTLEQEKLLLQANIIDAENALRTAAKDKELLTLYMKSVEKTIDACKLSSSKGPIDLTPILSPDLIPRDFKRAGPEVSAFQLLVTAFVDSQASLNNQLRNIQEDLASSSTHINTLKRELSAACQREFDEPIEMELIDDEPSRDMENFTSFGGGEINKNFKPLIEDTTNSFTAPRSTLMNQMKFTYPRNSDSKSKTIPNIKKRSKSTDGISNHRPSGIPRR